MFIFDTVIYLVIPCIILRFAYVGYIPEIRQIRLLFFPFSLSYFKSPLLLFFTIFCHTMQAMCWLFQYHIVDVLNLLTRRGIYISFKLHFRSFSIYLYLHDCMYTCTISDEINMFKLNVQCRLDAHTLSRSCCLIVARLAYFSDTNVINHLLTIYLLNIIIFKTTI